MKKKKPLEERIQDYNECKEIFGDADFTSIMIAESICDTYSERKQYDKAAEYAKRNYEASLREYGVDEPTTFNLLAKLIGFYEKAGDRESIDSVVDEYYRIREETLEIEIPDSTDDDILF